MEKVKINTGDELIKIEGSLQQMTLSKQNPDLGDTYSYFSIDDQRLTEVVVQHPLNNYLTKARQTYYFKKILSSYALVAIKTSEKTIYPDPCLKRSKIIPYVFFLGFLAFMFFALVLGTPNPAFGFIIFILCAIPITFILIMFSLPNIVANKLNSLNERIRKSDL